MGANDEWKCAWCGLPVDPYGSWARETVSGKTLLLHLDGCWDGFAFLRTLDPSLMGLRFYRELPVPGEEG